MPRLAPLLAELFADKRGAFTGAVADRTGKVQTARSGTLFLDEIGELPQELRPKLLRLLQEKTYERVEGATEREAMLASSPEVAEATQAVEPAPV